VILPAASVNTSERNELFDVGITESLINTLASADGLIVRPLSSVREYAGANVDPVQAGREQKADYVMAPNYQVAGGKIKVTSQLFNVASGKIEETFQSQQEITDVFAAQDAIAMAFSRQLMTLFAVSATHAAKTRGTHNEDAYREYVQGMYLLDKRIAGALEHFEKAVALDPTYAQAWAGKALTHAQLALSRNDEHASKAVEAINNALSINPELSEAYSALCHTRLHFDWDKSGAEAACTRAIELDPTSAVARQKYSTLLSALGRADEGLAQTKIAMESEPASYVNQIFYANDLYYARRFEEAIDQYRVVIALKPDRVATYNWFIRALEAQGREVEAFEVFIASLAVEGRTDEFIQRFRSIYETAGYKGVLLERLNTIDRDNAFRKAGIYARLGDKDKAFAMLEESYRERAWHMSVLFPLEPQLDPIRSDPRFHDLLSRVDGQSAAMP
jgi:TolB-like protein